MNNLTPQEVRYKLIEEFKRTTPKTILSNFKDDNDIWEFIVENSKITVKLDEEDLFNDEKD